MRYAISGLLTILLAAVVPGIASAGLTYSYTLKAPVTATNLPAGATMNIGCNYAGPAGASGQVFSAYVTPAANGSYSGTIDMPVTTTYALVSYACWLQVWVGGNVVNYTGNFGNNATPGWTGTIAVKANV
jgi:hypothetical protein